MTIFPLASPSPSPLLIELVDEAGDAAWVQPAISALLLIVGAAVGSVGTLLLERRRETREDLLRASSERREDFHRFDDQLRTLVGELTVIGERIMANAMKIDAWRESPTRREIVEEMRTQTLEDIPRMWAINIAIRFISEEEIFDAAEGYSKAVQAAADFDHSDYDSHVKAKEKGDTLALLLRKRLTGPVPASGDSN